MLQRSTTRFGKALGKTTGWIHKARLDHAGVKMIGGVEYKSIDKSGITIDAEGKPSSIASKEIILCAGQESQRDLYDELERNGITAHIIGGAKDARRIDAERAILEAYQLALEL
jgi:2,4-dienoyl-CoA reductase (NADPH2)